MLRYKKGRFFSGSISFVLPDDSYLVMAEALTYFDNGIEFTCEDESVHVTVSLQNEESSAKFGLDAMLSGSSFVRLSDTCSIFAGELSGYYAFYKDKRYKYCEYRFDIPEKNYINTLIVLACVNKTDSIKKIQASAMIQALLDSLKRE